MAKKQNPIPWMREPVKIDLTEPCQLDFPPLDPRLKMALHDTIKHINGLLAVQVAVWHETIGPGSFERDLFITSPTGTGKTLAYVLPILQALSTRVIKCLRALVVVPTRVLAEQVKRVFDKLAPAVGLSVGLAVGQSSIEDEISSFIKKPELNSGIFYDSEYIPSEPRSLVDILVATPGRLMEHINYTDGFTLEHLQYLVIDEADRLLSESYQSWLLTVLQSAYARNQDQFSDNIAPTFGSLRTVRSFGVERGFKCKTQPRLVKIAVSATLADHPGEIAPLPLLVITKQRLPLLLKSYKLEFKPQLKQLYLLALLESLQKEKCIVFTKSIESAEELCTSLNSFNHLQTKIQHYSSKEHSRKSSGKSRKTQRRQQAFSREMRKRQA